MVEKPRAPMRISELARRAELPKSTVAYYGRVGLLSRPTRTGRTMAYYDRTHLEELRTIRKLRAEKIPIAFIRARMAKGKPKRGPLRARPSSLRLDQGADRSRLAAVGHGVAPPGRRQQIIEGASRVFLRKGFDRTSIADVIEQVPVGRSTFYLYFRDKRGLFLECIDNMFNSIFTSEMWDEIRQEEDPLKRLRKRAQITLTVSPDFFEILRLLRSCSRHESLQLEAKAREIYRRVIAPVKSDLERGMRQGVFRDLDPNLLSYVFLGAIEALSLMSLQNEGYTAEKALGIVVDFAASGLSRRADDVST